MPRLPNPGSDDGVWGELLNEFLTQSHTADGSLKVASVTAAGAELTAHKNSPSGYAGLDSSSKLLSVLMRNGISQRLALIYEPCDLLATIDDLNAYGYYIYDNGAAGVGATITGPSNGQLIASGTPVTAGQRIAVHTTNMYGSTTDSGIYVVTRSGGGSASFILTRAADADTPATLGAFFATQVTADGSTIYFMPEARPFVVGSTHITATIEVFNASAEGGSSATAQFAHAEGESSTASGLSSHAEGNATASGDLSHAEGQATAQGDFSHAESSGYANGTYAHAEGSGSADGDYAHAEGNANASAHLSHAEGNSQAYAIGMHSEGSGQGQFGRAVRVAFTYDTTPTATSDNYGSSGFVFPDYTRGALLRVRVVARRMDTPGTVSAWSAECLVDGDNTGSFRFVGSPSFTLIAQDAGAATWSVSDLAFDGGDHHRLIVEVIGESAKAVFWTATIELDEVH